MPHGKYKWMLIMLVVLGNCQCRKSYAPPETNANRLFLSVDGLINTGVNSISSFKLTRSQNLSDTLPEIPEMGAAVSIQSSSGAGYPLVDSGANGIYVSKTLTLDTTKSFVLSITTSDGNHYESDSVIPKLTPPIDSLTWTPGFDGAANEEAINIYLNTHDPASRTRYYRWDYTETWEHQSAYKTFYIVVNKKITYESDPSKHTWYCWTDAPSTNILLGSSSQLSADIIDSGRITRLYKNDPKMDMKYSILVRQYALDAQAYDYWLLVQKTSQSLGGLYDIQPAQLIGNLHNLTTPAQTVYGYVSASSVQSKRIFISNDDLPGWKSVSPLECPIIIYKIQEGYFDYTVTDPNFSIYGWDTKKPPNQLLMPTACLDCTIQGGSVIQPPYWQ